MKNKDAEAMRVAMLNSALASLTTAAAMIRVVGGLDLALRALHQTAETLKSQQKTHH